MKSTIPWFGPLLIINSLQVAYILGYQRHGLVGLASLAVVVNFSFVVFVVRGCHSRETHDAYESRMPTKRYLFVLNRSFADLITAGVTLVYLLISLWTPCLEDPHYGCTTSDSLLHPLPLQMVVFLDFWNVAASYTGVSLLIVYAVRSPIIYKIRLTVRHVYGSIMLSWLLLLLALGAIYWHQGFNESFDSNGMIYIMLHGYYGETSYWQSDLCSNLSRQEPLLLAIVSLAIPCFLLLLATFSYILVTSALCTRQGTGLHQNALFRLGMHLGLFAITVCLMASTYFVSIPLPKHCREKNRDTGNCGYKPFLTYAVLSSAGSFGWYLRMTLDVVIDVAIDATLRRLLFPRARHRLSTYTLSTENHRFSMTAPRNSTPADGVLATRMILLFLFPLAIFSYPYSSYNGHYNRFGDYILPSRPEYYSSYSSPYYGSFSSYSTPSVVVGNHGYGDFYRGFGNGFPTFGASDGRYLPSYRSYPPMFPSSEFGSFPMEHSLRFPFKKQ